MLDKKKKITLTISILVILSMLPGVLTDAWDLVSPAKSLDEFEPFKTSYLEGGDTKSIDISTDGKFVVSSTGSAINFWNRLQGDESFDHHVMNDESSYTVIKREPYWNIVDIEFSEIGNYYLVGSNSNSLYDGEIEASHLTLYNMTHSRGVASRVFRTHQVNGIFIEDTAISPDENTYVACTEMTANPESCTITFWDIKTGEVVNSITSDNYKATSITFTPDGKYLVASFDNDINPDRIVFFDLESGDIFRTIEERPVADIQFSDDGKILVAGSLYRSEVIVWDGTTYEEIRRLKGLDLSPDSTALSFDGKSVMAMDFHRLIVWDTDSGGKIVSSRSLKLDFVDAFRSGTFSDDGKYIVIALDAPWESEYITDPPTGPGMVFIYDFEEIVDAYHA
jgi:WD40 repeat protein